MRRYRRLVAETGLRVIETEKPKLRYAVGREKTALLFKRLLPQSRFEGQVRKIFKRTCKSMSISIEDLFWIANGALCWKYDILLRDQTDYLT